MYASQTKRLCVRGAPSDENRVQHHSSSSSYSSPPHNKQPSSLLVGGNMTASASGSEIKSSNATTISDCPATTVAEPSSNHPINSSDLPKYQCLSDALNGKASEFELINRLANETSEESRLELLLSIRNLITACNRKKDSVVSDPNFVKVISLIDDNSLNPVAKTQLALLLCSLAKSGEHNVKVLNESLVDSKMFDLILNSHDETLIEACLRCMRSIMSWPSSRTWLLYGSNKVNQANSSDKDSGMSIERDNLNKIIVYAQESKSFVVQECIADIFAATCSRNKDQLILYKASAIPCIVKLLESQSSRVLVAGLNWLAQMCLKNHIVAMEISKTSSSDNTLLLDRLVQLMRKDLHLEIQFLAAKCFTLIYRALSNNYLKGDQRIMSHVLPTLVRMVHKDKKPQYRVKGAECIAYLIELDTELQASASVCDHLIESLANMLDYDRHSKLLESFDSRPKFKCSRFQDKGISWLGSPSLPPDQQSQTLDLRQTYSEPSKLESLSIDDPDYELSREMKRASFLALASLASNLEPIRKKIFNTCSIMHHLVKSLTDTDNKTLKSVLTCLLCLSRSVGQLRTSFVDNCIYSALKHLLITMSNHILIPSNEVLVLVLAILCNISLDFAPGKEHFLDDKTIEILCNLTKRSDPVLRLHGMWILMNMVYQVKDLDLKFTILKLLDIDHVLDSLETETDEEMVIKTLGFIRNILSQKTHIDSIMVNYGEQIMQALVRVFMTKTSSKKIKEVALCVLTNIADGDESKRFIMDNRLLLAYLVNTISDEQAGNLRLASICCVTNLAHKECGGAYERRETLRKLGFEEKLKSLLNTNDTDLSNRIRTAYNQFVID